jgi:hypothetical protein
VLEPVTLEVPQPCLPGWLALAGAVPPSDQCFVATGVSAKNDQETMPPFLPAGLKGDTVHPARAIPLALEAATWPLRQCLGPALLQSAARRRGAPRRLGPSEGLERRRAIPRRDAFELEPGQQRLEAFRPPDRWRQEGRVNAKPTPTTLPPPRPLEAHGPNPGLHLALGPGAMPDHRWAALESVAVRLLC